MVLRHWVVGSWVLRGPRPCLVVTKPLGFLTKPNQTMVKTWFPGCVGSHPRTKLRIKAKILSKLIKRERK